MSASKKRLGRGFDVLIPKDLDTSLLDEELARIQKILINEIKANPDQPRREFDDKSLEGLASSIKQHGILQPIILVRNPNGGYKIVAGERRWRAAQRAKLKFIPAIVRSLEELEQVELALIENIQRVDLSPLEQALSVYRLQHHFNLSLDQISKKLGKAPSTVSNLSRLLRLPELAREALRSQKISEGHARAILALSSDLSKQEELLNCIINNNWNVRQAEQFAINVKKKTGDERSATRQAEDNDLVDLLSNELHTTVKLKHYAKGGELNIAFESDNHLNQITQYLIKNQE
ncbi:ParB/RepB/Spo0J family partition protein [Candidatus Saccharibacteria bacterium]|nr:ParB/RepB/Spo0J family partition protein [Candidatus Saccharibacteria bacterium]